MTLWFHQPLVRLRTAINLSWLVFLAWSRCFPCWSVFFRYCEGGSLHHPEHQEFAGSDMRCIFSCPYEWSTATDLGISPSGIDRLTMSDLSVWKVCVFIDIFIETSFEFDILGLALSVACSGTLVGRRVIQRRFCCNSRGVLQSIRRMEPRY